MKGDRYAIEKDVAAIERVHAADAFDQSRLARAIVAEQRENFAAIGFKADVLERMHRAEALFRVADGEDGRCRRPGSLRARGLERSRPRFKTVPEHVGFDRYDNDQADGDHLEKDVDVEQVERVADHADHHRADERVADVPAPAEEARAADDDRGNGVEFEQIAVERRAGAGSAGEDRPLRRPRKIPRSHRSRPARL